MLIGHPGQAGLTALRVLIHNSDSPENRGDRAILVGVIELVRRRWPDAEIWSLSQYAERDESWFGVRFLSQSPYSTNPVDWLRLLRLARRSDVVLWGGGEILKDYTNKLGLVYWLVKLTLLSWANRRIVGAFQGIGPTSSGFGRRAIRATVNRTRAFITRDEESRAKLVAWGVRPPVLASFDPAVLGSPTPLEGKLAARLKAEGGIDAAVLPRAVGLGLRRWFHYRRSGWIPNRYRRTSVSDAAEASDEYRTYRERVALVADRIVEQYDADVVFFPMHMEASEGDAAFAREVIDRMKHGGRTHVLEADVFSSNDYAGVMAGLRFFVASRLHSAILATVARVPAFALYYVDKGRLFFEQMGLSRLSAPIESMLETDAVDALMGRLDELVRDGDGIRREETAGVERMAERLVHDFDEACGIVGL